MIMKNGHHEVMVVEEIPSTKQITSQTNKQTMNEPNQQTNNERTNNNQQTNNERAKPTNQHQQITRNKQ